MRNLLEVATAIYNGEESVSIKGKEIKLPKGQTSGTGTQKMSYARMKAAKVLKDISSN
tara:strand:- start:732 stop:905 length:174 start_codon:yes stop_codon:yes gene_type:complete